MRLKKSKYTREIKLNESHYLILNLLSGSECLLTFEELGDVNNFLLQSYTEIPEMLKKLQDLGFLVDWDVDENKYLELERKINTYSFGYNEVGFVIAPTMDCNARCFYCYENKTRSQFYMSQKVNDKLIEFIKKTAIGKKKLFISWFGGEPLLCKELLKKVSAELIDFCNEHQIKYYSELTTNGYYLNEIVDDLNELKIEDIQITIDGYNEEYLKRKNYINCDDAWNRIVDNIFLVSQLGFHVTLRMNIDRLNIDSIKDATEFFLSNSCWNKNISIYYYPLESNGFNADRYFTEQEYESVLSDLYRYLYDCGYYKNREYALGFNHLSLPCYGATLGIVAVDYAGYIYQCQHLLCQKEHAIGNIYDGIKINKNTVDWYDGKVKPKCEECIVLPLCQGGCVTKEKLGLSHYKCHMSKYKLKIIEELKAKYYKNKFGLE
ncbi:MAG: radical SAM protein [Ruminococcus flavefaciens]|nr:radical SAM protein [Ruminococcus flavefaciens]